jgi:hypothetical protein
MPTKSEATVAALETEAPQDASVAPTLAEVRVFAVPDLVGALPAFLGFHLVSWSLTRVACSLRASGCHSQSWQTPSSRRAPPCR